VSIKDVLVALAPRDEADPARDYALALASAHGAHVTAAAYPIVPEIPGSIFPEFAAGLAQQVQADGEAAAKAARERFERAASNAMVNHSFHGFSSFAHAVASDFATRLRTADVGILTQHEHDLQRYGDYFVEAALFRSGRPIIVVPRKYTDTFSTRRVLIAWDGSVHAARAVASAMPLLEGADIEVFTVEEPSKGSDFRGSGLVDHLRRHGLNPNLTQRSEPDIPATIIKEAELFRASLIVMGGYGHSRFREFIFGGVTRLMLSQMPSPVLMAH